MKSMIALSMLFTAACTTPQTKSELAEGPSAPDDYAQTLTVRENWIEGVEILATKSNAPQFIARITVTMPTPGWKLTVDEVVVSRERERPGRITVRTTATPPEGNRRPSPLQRNIQRQRRQPPTRQVQPRSALSPRGRG